MCYSFESKDRICVKDYGFLSIAKNIGKNWSGKYTQNAKKSVQLKLQQMQ